MDGCWPPDLRTRVFGHLSPAARYRDVPQFAGIGRHKAGVDDQPPARSFRWPQAAASWRAL